MAHRYLKERGFERDSISWEQDVYPLMVLANSKYRRDAQRGVFASARVIRKTRGVDKVNEKLTHFHIKYDEVAGHRDEVWSNAHANYNRNLRSRSSRRYYTITRTCWMEFTAICLLNAWMGSSDVFMTSRNTWTRLLVL